MSDLYRNTYRVLMIDQHFPDAPYITFSKFDGAAQIRSCKESYVDSIHITMKCHWGYSYYNTQIGIKHPALGDRDQAAELLEEARKEGLEAIAYYCLQFENLAAREHENWRFMSKDGRPATWHRLMGYEAPHSWDMPCFMTGYRQYCLAQIEEFATQYDFDGLFLDIFSLSPDFRVMVCYCPTCMKRYRELGLDPYSNDPVQRFALVRDWQKQWAQFLSEIRNTLDKSRPGMSLSLNGGPFTVSWESLRQVSWPYGEGGNHAYNCVALRGTGLESPQCGIPAGNDVYDLWPATLVRIMTSTVLAHGCRTFFFFLQGRLGDGTFERSKYELMRQINKETVTIENWVRDAVPLRAAAVYHSEASLVRAGTQNKSGLGDSPKDGYAVMTGAVIDAFRSASIPCELLPSFLLSDDEIGRYKMVVLPENRCMSDGEVEIFGRYVEGGGVLVVTGDTGLSDNSNRDRDNFALADLLGVDYEGICTEYQGQSTSGYMRFDAHPFFGRMRQTDYYMPGGNFIKVKARDAEVVARIAEPVGIESNDAYIGWGSLPPGSRADWPCVTVARRGSGVAIYVAAPLARYAAMGLRWPVALILGIADTFNINGGVKLDGPDGVVEATFFRRGENRLIAHILNQSIRNNNGVVNPVRDCKLECIDFVPTSARTVYPVERALDVSGRIIELPPVELHTIVEINI